MTDERWREVKALFQSAVERPPSERTAFIAAVAGSDDMLRCEVESLLDSDDAAPESLERLPLLNPALLADAMPAAWSGQTSADGTLAPGEVIGCYEVIELMGAGGMGEVYRARDRKLNRDVALKVLPRHFALDGDRLSRFRREAHVLAVFNHPNIAAIYGLEEWNDQVALVLELVEGPTLADVVADGSLPLDQALRIAVQVAEALEAAHAKRIVHRDLKPANIKLTQAGGVKVLDFGLAQAVSGEQSTAAAADVPTEGTRAGLVAGTPGYMSPEQAQGGPVDARADVWAFGCVLLEMLTGTKSSSVATLTMAANGGLAERELAWQELPRMPRRVVRVLRRCLETDPARRFATIAEVHDELTRVLSRPTRRAWSVAGLGAAAIVAAVVGVSTWRHEPPAIANRSDWVQLTNLDSVTQPALSPDGRTLAFVRGAGTFTTSGDVYIKALPDGEPVALTHDGLLKMEPVFSPDGSRIAYTVADTGSWNTWVVGIGGSTPVLWRPNASGLTWLDAHRLLFSEIKSGQHMAIAIEDEGVNARDVYVPPVGGMAHRSYASPDGKWLIVVEMDQRGVWLPCRVVPSDGSSPGYALEPRRARCTGATWSPDGNWIYSSVNVGDGFHLWRQAFPRGTPQQLTAGPTEEEGIAVAPDGKSLITSVGLVQRSVWFHDGSGDRQVSLEGYAYWPLLSSDVKTICFRLAPTSASGQTPTELWMADLASGRRRRLLSDHLVTAYDLGPDNRVIAAVQNPDGTSRLWLAWLDNREPPQPIPGIEGDNPRFGSHGEIYFRGLDTGNRNTFVVFRMRADGTHPEVVFRTTGSTLGSVSPDGRWLTHTDMGIGTFTSSTVDSTNIATFRGLSRLRWSGDGRVAFLSVQEGDTSSFGLGRTYVLPVRQDALLPNLPSGGFLTEADVMKVPGVRVIPYGDLAPGPSADVYAFSRTTTTRNLYRIPLE